MYFILNTIRVIVCQHSLLPEPYLRWTYEHVFTLLKYFLVGTKQVGLFWSPTRHFAMLTVNKCIQLEVYFTCQCTPFSFPAINILWNVFFFLVFL